MDILQIIKKKKNGQKLSKEEIQFFIDGVCSHKIKDFQITSLLMAICLKGIDAEETYDLTMAMARSGKMLDLSDLGNCLDKHSTGGVSDTVSLVAVPTVASLGIKVAKMSGRSLGFTGGTVDKVEVFKGYKTEIPAEEFKKILKTHGASIISQSADFAYADKILYKLRSESETIDNIGLIASSIMSKKIACGAKILILDVKYGNGAFMKTLEDSKKLARSMVEIGKMAGVKVCAVISSMEQPLTNYIGNNLEVYSALKVLSGEKNDLSKLAVFITAQALMLENKCKTLDEATKVAQHAIDSGNALKKLAEIILAHGGSTEYINNSEMLLPQNNKFEIFAEKSGYVEGINTELVGILSHDLQKVNGEVVRQDDTGIILSKRIGDHVEAGEKLLEVYYNKLDDIDEIKNRFKQIFVIGDQIRQVKLIDDVIM